MPNPLTNPNLIETGDVNLIQTDLSKINDPSKTYNLLPQIGQITLWEDITRSSIIADITVSDGLNILKRFPITGEEYLDLQFQTPGTDVTYNIRLVVYGLTNLRINVENQHQMYTLKCCTPEFLTDGSILVGKGYNTTIDLMIQDILTNFLNTEKNINVSPTMGVQKIVIPRLHPFKAIDMLTKRAVSATRQSSSFMFFENRNGFNFYTLEDLISNGVNRANIPNYFKYTALKGVFQNPNAHWNIYDYVVSQQFNTIDVMRAGGFQCTLQTFDFETKNLKENIFHASQYSQFVDIDTGAPLLSPISVGAPTTGLNPNLLKDISTQKFLVLPKQYGYDNSEQYNAIVKQRQERLASFNILSEQGQTGEPIGTVGQNNIRSIPDSIYQQYGNAEQRMMRVTDITNDKPETFISSALPNKLGFMAPLLSSSYDIYINGDSRITVGDVINITIFKPDKLTDASPDTPDTMTNGNYIITKLMHNIAVSITKPKYTAVATISRATYKD